MALLPVAEIFGHTVWDDTPQARDRRDQKHCPFRSDRCNKGNLKSPLGICSFGDSNEAGVVCPSRFLEDGRIFTDVGRAAFGGNTRVVIAPEMRILRVCPNLGRRIGKVDYIVAKLGDSQEVIDFAALEVQAV
jgi:hypothetical protein